VQVPRDRVDLARRPVLGQVVAGQALVDGVDADVVVDPW
jgi:hypothetical protein